MDRLEKLLAELFKAEEAYSKMAEGLDAFSPAEVARHRVAEQLAVALEDLVNAEAADLGRRRAHEIYMRIV